MSEEVEARIARLGLQLPEVAKPLAAYAQAVVSGNHVYTCLLYTSDAADDAPRV